MQEGLTWDVLLLRPFHNHPRNLALHLWVRQRPGAHRWASRGTHPWAAQGWPARVSRGCVKPWCTQTSPPADLAGAAAQAQRAREEGKGAGRERGEKGPGAGEKRYLRRRPGRMGGATRKARLCVRISSADSSR